MQLTKNLLSGVLAAALCSPAMAQGLDIRFGDDGFRLRYGSRDDHRGHGHRHGVRASLRFDPAAPQLRTGESLHLHADLVSGRRARRLTARDFASARLISAAGRASLRADGDGFRFRAVDPGRYVAHFLTRSGVHGDLVIRVREAHRPVRMALHDGRGQAIGDRLLLRPGQQITLDADVFDQHGHQLRMPASFELCSASRGNLFLHEVGQDAVHLHAGRRSQGAFLLTIRSGGLSRTVKIRVGHPAPRLARIQLQARSRWGSHILPPQVVIRRGQTLDLSGQGFDAAGGAIATSLDFGQSCALLGVDAIRGGVRVTGRRAGRRVVTVRDRDSGVSQQVTIIIR